MQIRFTVGSNPTPGSTLVFFLIKGDIRLNTLKTPHVSFKFTIISSFRVIKLHRYALARVKREGYDLSVNEIEVVTSDSYEKWKKVNYKYVFGDCIFGIIGGLNFED